MVDQLRYDFNIKAEEFATLGALYLVAYSLLQIPLGIIVDKIGVKKTVIGSILLCIFGSYLFASATEFWVAQVSRFIIGAGSAAAFMCSLKIIADHLPPGSRGLLMGATLTLGTIGAILSGKAIVFTLQYASWRNVVYNSVWLGCIIFIFALLLIKSEKQDKSTKLNTHDIKEISKNIIDILCHRSIMIYAILAIGLYTPLVTLTDLWGTAFLKQKFSLSLEDAAHINLMMYLGLAFGSLILPWLCEKYNILNRAIFFCGLMILFLFSIVLYGPIFSNYTLTFLMISLGFFCGAEMICFTGALQFANKENSGEIIGVVNTLNMLGGAILQQSIGYSLDLQWDQTYDLLGMRHYNTEQFINALSILTGVIIFCCLISITLKSIKVKKQY